MIRLRLKNFCIYLHLHKVSSKNTWIVVGFIWLPGRDCCMCSVRVNSTILDHVDNFFAKLAKFVVLLALKCDSFTYEMFKQHRWILPNIFQILKTMTDLLTWWKALWSTCKSDLVLSFFLKPLPFLQLEIRALASYL